MVIAAASLRLSVNGKSSRAACSTAPGVLNTMNSVNMIEPKPSTRANLLRIVMSALRGALQDAKITNDK
jgi:hypothetical protein